MTRILIVDDQDDMRAGIRAMLLLDPSLVVVGDLSDGLQVIPFLAIALFATVMLKRSRKRRAGSAVTGDVART